MRKRIVNLILALSMFFTATFISPVSHEVLSREIDTDIEQVKGKGSEETDESEETVEEEEASTPLINENEANSEEATTQDSIEEKATGSQMEEEIQEPKEENTTVKDPVEESVEEVVTEETDENTKEEAEVEDEPVKTPNTARTAVSRQSGGFTPPAIQGPAVQEHFTSVGTSVSQNGASSNMMILTDHTEDVTTARWSNKQLDLSNDFTIEMFVYINGTIDLSGDGLTFTMHNDPNKQEAIGAGFGGLGAYDEITRDSWQPDRRVSGISNGLSIEFDMFNDIQRRTRTRTSFIWDNYNYFYSDGNWNYDGDLVEKDVELGIGQRHTAFVHTKSYQEGVESDTGYPGSMEHINPMPIQNPHSHHWRQLTIKWEKDEDSGRSGVLSYKFVENPNLNQTIENRYEIKDFDAIFDTDGNGKVWWGVTASTGTKTSWEASPRVATMDSAVAFETIPQQTVEMEMFVRNITRKGDFKSQETIEAYPGDVLEYKYTLINPKINGVFDGWKEIQITNEAAGNILEPTPGTFVNYNVEYDFDKDARVEVNGGEFKVKDDAEAGTYSNLTATATGNIGESTDTTTATSNDVTIEVLPIPEVNFTQKVVNTSYKDGNESGQKVIDIMEGDEIALTAYLELASKDYDSPFPVTDQYSITLPSVLLNSSIKVKINDSEVGADKYSIDTSTSTLSIGNIGVLGAGRNKIEIFSTVGEITKEFHQDLKAQFDADNGLVLKEDGLEMSFIPNDGILFEVADLDFGTQVISSHHERYERVVGEEPLIRIELPVRSTQEFTKVTASYDPILPGTTIEKENGQEFTEINISEFKKTDNVYTWNSNHLYLNVPAGKALLDEQSSEITWTLQNVPLINE